MKSFLSYLAIVALSAIGTTLAAQTAPTPMAHPIHAVDPQKLVDHLARKLALTADQQSQILPIVTDRQQQSSTITSDMTLTPKQRHARLKAVRSDSDSRIRNILTDTQRNAYDEMQQQAREKARTKKLTQTTVQ